MDTRAMFGSPNAKSVKLYAVSSEDYEAMLVRTLAAHATWLKASGFRANQRHVQFLPDGRGGVDGVVLGLGRDRDKFATAVFVASLPDGHYHFAALPDGHSANHVALAWAMGHYAFNRFKSKAGAKSSKILTWPEGADRDHVLRVAEALFLARDLVNTPANEMGPSELALEAEKLAKKHGAQFSIIEGRALVEQNFPMIWAVGAGSSRAPRLIELNWGNPRHPKVTLVGKGVCFDSGGLDIKPASAMATMKKDMGGAACVLGVAHAVMDAKLSIALRVLIPAVENGISGDAYRPGDVLKSRKGLTVEVGNTDAEGRLVLADALALADEDPGDLLMCVATLTGAARIATGFDLPPFFSTDDGLADELMQAGSAEGDALWRFPLWQDYSDLIEGKVADLSNDSSSPNAGAITAALFLSRFVEKTKSFAHFDIAAWNDRARPGRPLGADAQALRAIYEVLRSRYS